MYISVLADTILKELEYAEEAWLATGLITQSGLPFIENINANIHVLTGIDLPTPPLVLRQMMNWANEGKLKFKVFTLEDTFFHPKVYIWRNGQKYKAYVGSGNLTNGGWSDNVELFWEVDSVNDCKKLIDWFNRYMEMGIIIDDKFITDYEENVYKSTSEAGKKNRKLLKDFKKSYEHDYEFYFRQEDFDAFTEERAVTDNSIAKQARKSVHQKLLNLHDRIFPEITKKGWDLHHHHRRHNIVSSYAHNARVSKLLNGMWLYYGKSNDEAAAHPAKKGEDKSMNNHVRLQLIIRKSHIGIWCAIGKDNGSRVDRIAFSHKIHQQGMRQELFAIIKNLGDEYFIDVAGRRPFYRVADINTEKELYDIVNQDIMHMNYYFIIGMDIVPQDQRLQDSQITGLVITEFEKLYPLYNFLKAPYPVY